MTAGDGTQSSLTLLLVLLLTFTSSIRATVIEIDSTAVSTDPQSLQYHLCGAGAAQLSSNTTLVLSEGTHILEDGPFCVIQNLSNLTIQGHGLVKPQIKCINTGRGIAFFNISTLLVSNLEITNCGGDILGRDIFREDIFEEDVFLWSELSSDINNTFAYLIPGQKAVVIISSSIDITIESVTIFECAGFGVLLFNVLGSTVLDRVKVCDTNGQIQHVDSAGNGIAFIYDDSEFTTKQVKYGVNYTYLSIANSSFYKNYNLFYDGAVDELFDILLNGITRQPIPLTGGLSIAVYTSQRDYYVDINITNTNILDNNGNVPSLFLVHYDSIINTKTNLDNVNFTGNTADHRGSGFFLVVTIFYNSLFSLQPSQCRSGEIHNIASVYRSYFIKNSAIGFDGGGTIVCYISPQNISDIRFVIKNTTFIDSGGPALSVVQLQSIVNNLGLYVYLEDISAIGNDGFNNGIFSVSQASNITIVGTEEKGCFFRNNYGSIIISEGTNVILRGKIEFSGNRADRGGALNLVSGSTLYIYNGSDINFTRNIARENGGAIFINTQTTISFTDTCPIQIIATESQDYPELHNLDLYVTFTNNSALISGNSIYGNRLYGCNNGRMNFVDNGIFSQGMDLVYDNVLFNFIATIGNNISEINSLPDSICVCNLTTCQDKNQYDLEIDKLVIPGSNLSLYLVPLDLAGNPVPSILYSYLLFDEYPIDDGLIYSLSLGPGQDVMSLPGGAKCSSVDFQILAPENTSLSLSLSVDERDGLHMFVRFKTTFCPTGFTLSNDTACICSEFIEKRLFSTCNMTDYTVVRPPNHWIGTVTEDADTVIQYVTTCPINYCRRDLTYVDLTIQDHVCVEGRTGRICGGCKGNLSSVFGVAECRQCSNAWLATLLLFALVGILQVIFYFLLDFTITHGLINGLFFYSNIVIVNSSILFRENESDFLFWYVSWLNLDLGFPMCFYNGMTESAKAGFQYVYPTYLILIIILIIVLSQHSLLMQRLFSQLSGIHVLVSMFYISFLKIFRTVIDTVTYVDIISEDSDDPIPAWFYDGNQKISDSLAIILIVLASVTLIFGIIPYVLFFTFFNLIQRWITSTRINAFVDANLAPYKPELRFWFGARLVLTTIIYIIITNRGISNPTLTLTLELSFLVGFALVQAYIQPFKSQIVSLIDLSILINLILLTLGTFYTIQNEVEMEDQKILVRVSLGVVFYTNIGIILGHLLMVLRKNKKIDQKMKNLLENLKKVIYYIKQRNWMGIKEMYTNIRKKEGEEGSNECQQNDHTGSRRNNPTSTIVDLQDLNNPQVLPICYSGSQLRESVLGTMDDENTPIA